MHERARAENMMREIRQLVKDQTTDITRLRQLSSDLQQLAAGLAAAGYTEETAGSAGRAGQNGRQRGATAAAEVIDAEFKPRS
jgi:molecular chaperone DnaK